MNSKRCHRSMFSRSVAAALALVWTSISVTAQAAEGNAARGSQHFKACIACHSLAPSDHLTGPSLHGLIGRKAGAAPGFQRYSPALRSSNAVWTAETLNAWLADPARFIPNNWMTFRGIGDAQARADLIAFLGTAEAKGQLGDSAPPAPGVSAHRPNLKNVKPEGLVRSVQYCGDAYRIRTASGREFVIWEFNLRLKTDSSPNGPPKGQPVLLGAGMQGDRASLIFNDPAEISAFIRRNC